MAQRATGSLTIDGQNLTLSGKQIIWKYAKKPLTLYFKVLFMSDQNQPTDTLQDVREIRRLMERSSRFISLSGLSGVAAGLWALLGAWYARNMVFEQYYTDYNTRGYVSDDF